MDLEQTVSFASLEDGQPTACTLSDGRVICLIRVGNEIFAMEDRCSHADFPMSGGDMVDAHVIECPLHSAQFDVRTGAPLEPPATEPIPTYEATVADGHVWVRRTA